MNRPWTVRDIDSKLAYSISDTFALTPFVADVMVARGITSVTAAERYLHPSLERDWSDPVLIPGMSDVADAMERAVGDNRRILVFGDFDVDGISATALMVRGLNALGADVDYIIPHRMTEGYGLTAGVLPRILEKKPEVLITVDCGISSRDEVAELLAHGIQVCITDHHEPSDSTPQGVPVADPKLEDGSPQAQLAGAGVALKLIAVLGERFGKQGLRDELADLASLGTMADLMPLTGENRSLVAFGLERMRTDPRPGITAVLALSQRKPKTIRALDLSFSLIPRLNAAGRMGGPEKALELLINDEPAQACQIAIALDEANTARREEEAGLLVEALEKAAEIHQGQKILIVAGEGWHEGVRGIVASRLAGRYGIPAIVFSLVDGEARGSGRSVGSVNLFKAVQACSDLMLRFGGHAAAVGLTVAQSELESFRRRIEAVMDEEPEENLHPPLSVDAQLKLSAIDVVSIDQLSSLEPYGQANAEPLFITCGATLQNARTVGANKNHLAFSVSDGTGTVQAIRFNCPDIEDFLDCEGPVDFIYRLQVDEWKGRKPKLMVERMYRSEATGLYPDRDRTDIDELAEKIVGRPIVLHDTQRSTLEALANGDSVLSVMATGRGKSLIFQIHAVRLALATKKVSVLVYPLRALIADQYRHIADSFSNCGLTVRALTGECAADEKDGIFRELYEGNLDVVLTTPEFLFLHAWRFAQSERIGFIVYDEAHHIHPERLADRKAYYELEELRKQFPHVSYLAVTATSDDRTTEDIKTALEIDRVIIDTTRRENLHIKDLRNSEKRDSLLLNLVGNGVKSIVYVNSRTQAIDLTRLIRKNLRGDSARTAFYHAGLARAERQKIEEGFRAGEFSTIVSTSAFGEGIDIPDVSQVILYHLPFNAVAFNQMSGRAGRDGRAAEVCLLYSEKDAKINEGILLPLIPRREDLVALYKILKAQARSMEGANVVESSFLALREACCRHDTGFALQEAGVRTGCAVFAELGLLEYEEDAQGVRIVLNQSTERVELSSSSLYLEGRDELALFEGFKTWALTASSRELQEWIVGPIIPTRADV